MSRPTTKQFWKAFEVQARLASIAGSAFENDTPAQRLRRMAEAIVEPERFNATYLPHYFPVAAAPFHHAIYRALERDKRIVVRAPRGHAKTTVMGFSYVTHQVVCAKFLKAWVRGGVDEEFAELAAEVRQVMREVVLRRMREALDAWHHACAGGDALEIAQAAADAEYAKRCLDSGEVPLHYDPYIQMVAVDVDLAAEFTFAILEELRDNDLIRSDWGEQLVGKTHAAGDWVSASNVRVKAFGMRSGIRGGKHGPERPTLIVIDDPDSEETVGTLRLRDKQTRKITAGANYSLAPKVGRIIMAGTPIHGDCLVCRFTDPKRYPRWRKLRFKAIQADGTALWADRWSLEDLRAEEAEDPEAFAMEMMDTPPSTGKPFGPATKYSRADYADMRLFKVLAFDPALGKTADADFQAVVVLRGPTPAGQWLLHRVEALRIGDPRELMRTVNGIVSQELPDVAVMETIGFQALLVVLSAYVGEDVLAVAWSTIDRQSIPKDLRIRGEAPDWNAGKILVPDDGSCRIAESQADDYPDGKVDVLDGMEMARRKAKEMLRPMSTREVRHGARRGGWRQYDDEDAANGRSDRGGW